MEKSVAERQILQDAVGIGCIHNPSLAETAAAFGVFALQQVAAPGVRAHDFSGARDFKTFGHGLLRFDAFGSSHKFNSIAKERAIYAAARKEASAIFCFLARADFRAG
jgi:hypothetical protein